MRTAKRNNQVIHLDTYTAHQIQKLKTFQDYHCPYCNAPVRLKQGTKRRAHFAHIIPCHYHSYENESPEHQAAKKLLATWLQSQNINPQIEWRLPEIKRIADIYFVWEQQRYVLEIQKSPLTAAELEQRTKDYATLEINAHWIFIGDLVKKKHTVILNRAMATNKEQPLIYLNLKHKKVMVFNDVTWITGKEIWAKSQTYSLSNLKIQQLLKSNQTAEARDRKNWLAIKTEFRTHKWHGYMKRERKLLVYCAQYQINLALLPAEIGWQVPGAGFKKSLFIWQAYILFSILANYNTGDCFTLSQLIKLNFALAIDAKKVPQLKAYLNLLVKFGVLSYQNGYYEYQREPLFYDRLEAILQQDEKLSLMLEQF